MAVIVAATMLVCAAMFRPHEGHSGLARLAPLVLGLSLLMFILMWVLKRIVGSCAGERVTAHDLVDPDSA